MKAGDRNIGEALFCLFWFLSISQKIWKIRGREGRKYFGKSKLGRGGREYSGRKCGWYFYSYSIKLFQLNRVLTTVLAIIQNFLKISRRIRKSLCFCSSINSFWDINDFRNNGLLLKLKLFSCNHCVQECHGNESANGRES